MTTGSRSITELIDDVFRRISSGGRESVVDLFTEDAVYEGIYADDAVTGRDAISTMLVKVIPAAISPFRQWPIAIYPVAGHDDMVLTEYRSDGVGVHDGSIYRNKYVGVIRLRDGKIAYWREYYDPGRFAGAVGPDFPALVARLMPPDGMQPKAGDLIIADIA